MTVITYSRGVADVQYTGHDWEAMRWFKKNDTLIIDELWRFIDSNRNLPFDSLYPMLKELYKNKTVRSFADIHKDEYQGKGVIEITTRGIFPKILITQD